MGPATQRSHGNGNYRAHEKPCERNPGVGPPAKGIQEVRAPDPSIGPRGELRLLSGDREPGEEQAQQEYRGAEDEQDTGQRRHIPRLDHDPTKGADWLKAFGWPK